MKVLDLFAGKKGWSKAFEARGHEVCTVDIEEKFDPDICKDILELKVSDLPFIPDVVLASPPCEKFSVAGFSSGAFKMTGNKAKGTEWYHPQTPEAEMAMKLVAKTVQLVEEIRALGGAKYFVIENPRGLLRRLPLIPYARQTVTYCQYGDDRMKPTDLWGVFPESMTLKKVCKNGDSCHVAAPRGAKTGTQGLGSAADRAVIPYKLSLKLCREVEKYVR